MTEIRLDKYLKKLLGRNDVEGALKRLDKLTQEEARMTATEVLKLLKVSHQALDGARCTISVIRAVLNLLVLSRTSHATDSKRGKSEDTRDSKQHGPSEAFVISWCHFRRLSLLTRPHREPVATRPSKVAVSPGSLHKSQHCPYSSPRRNSKLVLPR